MIKGSLGIRLKVVVMNGVVFLKYGRRCFFNLWVDLVDSNLSLNLDRSY